MQIEEGKFYKTRDGGKVGPMWMRTGCPDWPWAADNYDDFCRDDGTTWVHGPVNRPTDLIAEWEDETGPVTIETVKRINTGTFKRVHVTPINDDFVSLHLQGQTFSATELRDISELATQLADALEGK